MILSHKIQLLPNKDQETQLAKSCGCSRFAYNWGLNKWNEMYNAWKGDNTLPKPSKNLIRKEFNKIKEAQFPWIYDSPKDSNQRAFINLGYAFSNFFNKISNKPKFKKKGHGDSFYVSNDRVKLVDYVITLSVIGQIKLTEKLRFEGKIMSCVVSRQSDKWFASIAVEMQNYTKPRISDNTIALDIGVKTLLTDQDGNKTESPKPLKKSLKRLAKASRVHSRRKVGSKRREKARKRLAKVHKRISDVRKDFTHKTTTDICRKNQTVIIEDLCVKGWSGMFGKNAVDGCAGELIRQLKYKKDIYGADLIIVDRWFPSTKTCSGCGNVKAIGLSERTYSCDKCGLTIDRDHNAAINLYTFGLKEINARGQGTSGKESFDPLLSSLDETRTLTLN